VKPETGTSLKYKHAWLKSLYANDVPRSSTTRSLGQEMARLNMERAAKHLGLLRQLGNFMSCSCRLIRE
jgi:plasmid maintenance system killer protein